MTGRLIAAACYGVAVLMVAVTFYWLATGAIVAAGR